MTTSQHDDDDGEDWVEDDPTDTDWVSLEALGRAAERTKTAFDEQVKALMTPERAAYVRALRCEEDYSWRSVAHACAEAWGTEWGSNQIAGIALCQAAAAHFKEDHNEEPWN